MKLSFLNLNIFEGGQFLDQLLPFLEKTNADIMCLQEIYGGSDPSLPGQLQTISILRKFFPHHELFFSAEFLHLRKEGKINLGNVILSRFPMRKKETIFFDIPYSESVLDEDNHNFSLDPKNLQHVEVDAGGIQLHVYNLHGIWGLDGVDNPRRLAMGQTIMDAVAGKDHVILSGDFNLKPNTETIKNIEKHLTNVFQGELTTTFNMKYKKLPGYATAVVDMVFVSKDINVITHQCLDTDVSDHLPLVCEFEIQM